MTILRLMTYIFLHTRLCQEKGTRPNNMANVNRHPVHAPPLPPAPAYLRIAPDTVTGLILFPCLFLCIWLWIDPTLNYYFPAFYSGVSTQVYTTWSVSDTPSYPGKLIDWAASLLTPAFANAFTGAVAVTLIAFITCWLFGRIVARLGAKNVSGLKYVPVMIMFLQYVYLLNPLRMSLTIIVGLTLALVFQLLGRWNWKIRSAAFFIFSVTVLTIAIKAFLVFAFVCILYECAVKRNYAVSCFVTFISACMPAAVIIAFFPLYGIPDAYKLLIVDPVKILSPAGLLPFAFWTAFFPIAALALFDKPLGKPFALLTRKKPGAAPRAPHLVAGGALAAMLVILLTGSFILADFSSCQSARADAVMNYAMLNRNWDLLLSEAGKLPKQSLSAHKVHIVDRALYYKGRLLDDLFMFPQNQNTLLLFPYTKTTNHVDRFWEFTWGGPTWFDLGLVNIAEHCALEALSRLYYPQGLQLLAMIYFVKDMPDAGRVCLHALCKDPVYRSWAKTILDSLDADPTPSSMEEIRNIRSSMLKKEFIMTGIPPLAALVKENPHNRMAFEYQIAWYLICRNVDSLSAYIAQFRERGYQKLPRCYEEALLLYAATADKKPDLCGYSISSDAITGFEIFYSIYHDKHGGRANEAYHDLAESCRGSFFFYYQYGISTANVTHEKK